MTDLFPTQRPLKVGQANGEFLAKLAMADPSTRATVRPNSFPDACSDLVKANAIFWGSDHA